MINGKNIVDKTSINYYSYNLKEFNKIYDDINTYYNFEKKFLKELKKNQNSSINLDYLISKTWIDNWKKYTNYDKIKENYLEKNETSHEIINKLIYYKEKYNYNYKDLNSIEVFNFDDIEDLFNFLKTDSLIIISYSFIHSFESINSRYNQIIYSLNENKINIQLQNQTFTFISNNNILSLDSNNKSIFDNYIIEKYLSYPNKLYNEFSLLNNCIKNKIIFGNSSNIYNSDENNYYLINKNYINELLSFFQWNELFNILNNNEKLAEKLRNDINNKEALKELKLYLNDETFKNKNNK